MALFRLVSLFVSSSVIVTNGYSCTVNWSSKASFAGNQQPGQLPSRKKPTRRSRNPLRYGSYYCHDQLFAFNSRIPDGYRIPFELLCVMRMRHILAICKNQLQGSYNNDTINVFIYRRLAINQSINPRTSNLIDWLF